MKRTNSECESNGMRCHMIGIETTQTTVKKTTKNGTFHQKSTVRKLVFPDWFLHVFKWFIL